MKLKVVIIAMLTTVFATVAFAHDGRHERNDRQPEQRIIQKLRSLEKQMEALQQDMRDIKRLLRHRSEPVVVEPAAREWGCYINTPFNGTFSAKGFTQAEAIGKTLMRCNEKTGNSIQCKDKRVVCSSTE